MTQRFLPVRVPVSLRTLLPSASFVGCADIRVTEATEQSSQCRPHTLFAAIPGTHVDGADFVDEAIKRGANSLLVQRPLPNVHIPQCVVPHARKAFAELCSALAGYPSRHLHVAAVTGTNGKTTVSWLIRSILETSGRRTGLLGTIEYHDGVHSSPSKMTTPDSQSLAHWLSAMVEADSTHAVLEVSSHALEQERTAGTEFDVAVVTNITHDHFDYHHDADSYRAAKARLLTHLKAQALVVLNADDPHSSALVGRVAGDARVVTYGLERPARVWATILEESLRGSRFPAPPCDRLDRSHDDARRTAQRLQLSGGCRGNRAVRPVSRRGQGRNRRPAHRSRPDGTGRLWTAVRRLCRLRPHGRRAPPLDRLSEAALARPRALRGRRRRGPRPHQASADRPRR